MNQSSLTARTSRTHTDENNPFYVAREIGRRLATAASDPPSIPDLAPAPDSPPLGEEVLRLRQALAQMLAHETGQNIQVFRSPAVDNARLCAIADNIWNLRHWSD